MCWALKDNKGDKKKSELVNLAAGCGSRKVRLKRGTALECPLCWGDDVHVLQRERWGLKQSRAKPESISSEADMLFMSECRVSPLTTALCSRHLSVTLEAHVEVY